jgi:protein-disulfide isomerase
MSERLEHRLSPPVGDDDHAQGPADAPVTLVEYGDYECPYCGRAYPIVKAVQAHFGPRLRFVFRNFPLTESHPHAAMAAASAEAAGDHGKFWEMHDLLFEHQDHLNALDLVKYGSQLGIPSEGFLDEIRSPDEAHRVREDFMSGVRSGVNGTPTFFINGVRHDGSWDFQGLVDAVGASMREGGAVQGTAPLQRRSRRT